MWAVMMRQCQVRLFQRWLLGSNTVQRHPLLGYDLFIAGKDYKVCLKGKICCPSTEVLDDNEKLQRYVTILPVWN
jgi:hypothetical protein